MRNARWLFLTALMVSVPTVAGAQQYYAPPPPPPPAYVVPPHVYVQQRVRWHLHRQPPPVQVYVAPGPAPVWVAPQTPPPPVYYTPPPAPPVVIEPQQPYYVQPQPIYAPPPATYAPPATVVAVREAPKPQFANRFGIGATVQGQFTVDHGDYTGGGILGQLRYRAARHLGLEIQAGYNRSSDQAGFARTDVPATFGLMIPILGPEYALSPYIVGAAGINFADVKLIDAGPKQLDDTRKQAIAQLGAGLELRLGGHFAINADVRLEGRWNLDSASEAVMNTTSIDGKPVPQINNDVAVRAGVGATLYF